MLIQVDRFVWAKETYEHLGLVYASGVAGGATVGEVRAQDRPRKLEVVQIRICAPCATLIVTGSTLQAY